METQNPRPARRAVTTRHMAIAGIAAAAAAIGLVTLAPSRPARAASLTPVTAFGDNPGNLGMHLYVPTTPQATPAIVVAMHPCGGSGQGFYQSSEFASLADKHGFLVIYPTSTKKIGCFDNWSDASKKRGGGTDAESIISMIKYAQQRYNGDPSRVYATGSSSGGMMTNALTALYPDVIKASAAFMGVPFGCFPQESDYLAANSVCATGNNGKTPQQWGDLARQAYPGYTGTYPRMQIWHGTADTVVSYKNFQEEIDQWTNLNGLTTTPTSTDTPQSGWTRQRFADASGTVRVESISVAGAGHSLPAAGMAARAIEFFGLTSTRPSASPSSASPSASASTQSPTASPSSPTATAGACRVTYATNSWNSGLTASITVANTSSTPVNGWTLAFTLPAGQTITSSWNATFRPASGQITATNVGYNATIPAQGSVSIGFQASHSGSTDRPTSFSLNGTTCAVA